MTIVFKVVMVLWLFFAYTYMATYYTALMNEDNRPEAQKTFVHIVVMSWFFISIYWLFKFF
jgi:hypothetical protein